MSVNRPTNPAVRDADVARKIQFYGIYQAFAKGKVPSNQQIDVALNSFLDSKALSSPSAKLSEEGRHLVADVRDVVEKAKLLLLTKNEGNLIQDFIWKAQHITGADAGTPNTPVSKDAAKEHGNQALDGLRTLGTLILSNGQFRKLLSDAGLLLRDIAGDAAQSAANKVNPDEEKLRNIDEPAADNQWHEVPSVADIKSQAKETYNKNKPISQSELQDAAVDTADSTQRDPNATGSDGAQAFGQQLQSKAQANIPDETQDKIKNAGEATRNKTKDYALKKLPKERRDQTIFRLKKMIVEIQGHEDYQQAIDTLLDLAETYSGYTKDVTVQAKDNTQATQNDRHLATAQDDLKLLLERFANSTSSDDIFDALNNVYRDAQKDPELKNWFKSVDTYIRKALKEQGYILKDDANTEFNKLYDQGNYLLRDRYRDHSNRLLDEVKFFGNEFDNDPQNKAFAESVNKLFTDLGNDENGKPTFKTHLVTDLTQVVLPGIFEGIRYVPLPRIEYTDPQIDAIIENLVVESDNLTPNLLEVTSDNFWRWGRKSVKSTNSNKVEVAVSGIQMDLKDVAYYVHKKEGFPSIKDKGVMDIFLGGSGFSFKLGLQTAEATDRHNFFKVSTVKVDIKNLKLKMKQSDHKLLFNLVKPLLLTIMKPALTKIIESQIRDAVTKLDQLAYSVKVEADKAVTEAKENPENAQNIYKRYASAAQQQIQKGQEKADKAQAKAAEKHANVAMTQNDSLFPQIKLPGGFSTKATEYQNQAAEGKDWQSPVFGLGSAKETSNIPKPAEITRKQHDVTHGRLRSHEDSRFVDGPVGENNIRGNAGYSQTGSSGQDTGAGYENNSGYDQSGHGQAGALGHNTDTAAPGTAATTGTGHGYATQGFNSQVNQAFDNSADLSLKQATGAATTSNGVNY